MLLRQPRDISSYLHNTFAVLKIHTQAIEISLPITERLYCLSSAIGYETVLQDLTQLVLGYSAGSQPILPGLRGIMSVWDTAGIIHS